MVDRFSIFHPCEPCGCLIRRHQPATPIEHECVAYVGFGRLAFWAFCTLALPHGYAFIPRLDVFDMGPNALTYPAKFED